MRINRKEIARLVYPYAVSIFPLPGGPRVVIATELKGECLSIAVDDLSREVIWRDMGGTMNICQLNSEGEFLAVQEFYKGNNSKTACLAKVGRRGGEWITERFFDLPFLHRFCLVETEGVKFLVISTLAKDKDNREDWSRPGSTYIMRLPEMAERPGELIPLIPEITKNHGMFKGRREGANVVMVSGQEGLFEIRIPARAGDEWKYAKLLDREISDMVVCDLDGDGVEEIITLEKFHGARLAINRPSPDGWREIYSYPVDFGHALWAGNILGRPGLLVGYRGANAALLLFRPNGWKDGALTMDIAVIDEHEAPTNIDVLEKNGVCKIFNCSGAKNRVMLYELSE
ncbi:MAG: hypothetical protein LBU64_08580 [Planctomycetota bacterium]|jgi:hypothetical protein|nr:hypothetical protein [Planctomycetota bacterium]